MRSPRPTAAGWTRSVRISICVVLTAVAAAVVAMGVGAMPIPIAASTHVVASLQYHRVQDPYASVPALYRNTVAWSGTAGNLRHPHPVHLYLAHLPTLRPEIVVTVPFRLTIIQTQLSAHWIAWEDQGQAGDWSIWAQNRQTGRRLQIDSSQVSGHVPHPWMFPLLSLSGETLAWSRVLCLQDCVTGNDEEHWTSSIQLLNLSTGAQQTVTQSPAPCLQYWPSLWSSILVWHQEGICSGVSGTDVFLFDRSTQRIRQLTTNHRGALAATNGRYVAWKDAPNRFQSGKTVLLNLATGKRTIVDGKPNRKIGCPDPKTGMHWVTCDALTRMTASAVVWMAAGGGTIMSYNLATQRRHVWETSPEMGPGRTPGLLGVSGTNAAIWSAVRVINTKHGNIRRSWIVIAPSP